MVKKLPCEIYYFSDMQKCISCGSCWDANDPYPPQCKMEKPNKVGFLDKIFFYLFGTKQL